MKNYLEAHKRELFDGQKVKYAGFVYWANMTTREIYTHTEDAEISGVIDGWKAADISDDWHIIPVE